MATRTEVVAEARTWLGTRFHHQARQKGVGVDCVNIIIDLGLKFQLTDNPVDWDDYPQYANYGRSPDGALLLRGCKEFLDPISYWDLKPADIAVFKFVQEPQHFALITQMGPLYMLHAYAQMRKVVEHRLDEEWQKKLVACFRFRRIEE